MKLEVVIFLDQQVRKQTLNQPPVKNKIEEVFLTIKLSRRAATTISAYFYILIN